ncbi:Ornithine carbamoyltransferase [hydrothermal vent metagenome]|uniref:Ornithine carbamoyltransferase n=1 Tax=hydrothermal vent metagenome TaxID=652676 RepID=A0A3B1DS69_9ZZZZ
MQHLRKLEDITAADVQAILKLTAELKQQHKTKTRPAKLQGHVLTMVFEKPSLRTRNSFEAAMINLGGSGVFLSCKEAGLDGREDLADIAKVLSGYSDVVVLRTFSQKLIDDFAELASCPVINGLSDDRHPCQALADLFTIQESFGDVENRHLVYIGDGNNVAASLVKISAMMNLRVTVCTPKGYEMEAAVLDEIKQQHPTSEILTTTNPQEAVSNADVIYTDVWASMGQEAEAEARKKIFQPFQINASLMSAAPANCQFMHCLPAHRGEEVAAEVIDGSQSIVFQQAENRMHLARGLFAWLLE